MENSDLLTVMIGASLLGLAALLVLVGMLVSRTKTNKAAHTKHVLALRVERDDAILEALAQPSEENVKWMWEKIDDYDRQRTSGT